MAITIEQLKAALERRGYAVLLDPPPEGLAVVTFEVYRNTGPFTPETPTLVRAIPLHHLALANVNAGEMAEELLTPSNEGQRHMACAHCGEPLLFKERYVRGPALAYGVPLEQVNHDRMEHEYRSAKVGPGSPELSACPACHSRLSKETVKEIEDL